jgi:hypothetical protein
LQWPAEDDDRGEDTESQERGTGEQRKQGTRTGNSVLVEAKLDTRGIISTFVGEKEVTVEVIIRGIRKLIWVSLSYNIVG